MRNASKIRTTMFGTALIAAFAIAPLTQVAAQDANAGMHAQTDNQTVPDKVADAWITTKVKSELMTTKGIPSTDISVKTTNGVVMLVGVVDTKAQVMKSVAVTKAIEGVHRVDASALTSRN